MLRPAFIITSCPLALDVSAFLITLPVLFWLAELIATRALAMNSPLTPPASASVPISCVSSHSTCPVAFVGSIPLSVSSL